MKSTFFDFIKRDLILGIVLSALVFACAFAWGGPFIATNQQPAPTNAAQTLAESASTSAQ